MFVEFWGAGASTASTLSMTYGKICSHLQADWVPSLPATVSSSFVGWPPYLIESVHFNGFHSLALRAEAGRSERRWKGVLSWMLGVAGTRQILEREGYRWIAPLSAFYPDAAQTVDLSDWHVSFPHSSVTADRLPNNHSRLRPDYVALRPLGHKKGDGPVEWAVVESKGTQWCLTNMQTCPPDWYNQARNVLVKVNGSPISIPRHLVVATRVNPNATRLRTRRIQVRVWNSKDEAAYSALPEGAAADIAAAHLFGFFRNLHLRENARALALSVEMRTQARPGRIRGSTMEHLSEASERAEEELRGRALPPLDGEDSQGSVVVSVETDFGAIKVEIAAPTLSLVRNLRRAQDVDTAAAALREADAKLNNWERHPRRVDRHNRPSVNLKFGVQVRLPQDFGQGEQ